MAVRITLDAGEPEFKPEKMGILSDRENFIGAEIELLGERGCVSCVGFEEAHCIFPVADADSFDIEYVGDALSRLKIFPSDIVCDFVQSTGEDEYVLRSWQSGRELMHSVQSAAAVAAVYGIKDEKCSVGLPDGTVEARAENGHILLTGDIGLMYAI